MLTFNVTGTPAPQGSKRAFVVNGHAVMAESSKKVKPWRQDVTAAALNAMASVPGFQPYAGPVSVRVVFWISRPGYHFRSGARSRELKPTAPRYVDKKPDGDKLLRATLDALTSSGVFRDDAQVAILTGVKEYADGPTGARIEIASLARDASADVAEPQAAMF